MKSIAKGLILFTMLFLVGFTIFQEEMKSDRIVDQKIELSGSGGSIETKNSITANEKKSFIQFINKVKMRASWYGPRFHGRQTANGEIYNQMAFTAAHKSIKFGTLLKLTNIKNGMTVIVRINDRGPYINGRQLDLSKGAATSLGIVKPGVVDLIVEEVALADENRPLLALN